MSEYHDESTWQRALNDVSALWRDPCLPASVRFSLRIVLDMAESHNDSAVLELVEAARHVCRGELHAALPVQILREKLAPFVGVGKDR